MLFYTTIYIVLLLLSFLDFKYPSKKNKIIFYIPIYIFFILLGSLRWRTGADWFPYYYYFLTFDWSQPFSRIAYEPSYVLLTKIVKELGGSYTVFLTVYTILMLGLRSVFMYKYINSILFGCLLYFANYYFDFAATRQWLAMSVAFLSVPYIINRKLLPFVAITLIAATIHVSLAFFLFAYFIYNAKWSAITQYIILIICIAIGYSGITAAIFSAFDTLIPSDVGRLSDRAETYMGMGSKNSNTKPILNIILGLLKRAVIIPVLIYFKKPISEKVKYYSGFLNLYIFGNAFYFIVGPIGQGLERIASIFYPFEIILICLIIDHAKNRKLWFLIFLAYSLVKFIFASNELQGFWVPFYSIFDTNTPREHYNFTEIDI